MSPTADGRFSPLTTLALIAGIAIVGTATVQVYLDTVEDPMPDARPDTQLVLNATDAPTGGVAEVTVERASLNLTWGSLRMVVNGTDLAYDTDPSSNKTFCVSNGEETCTPADVYARSTVDAGDVIRVHLADLAGTTLRVVEEESNDTIAKVQIPASADAAAP